jgi:hypothetical protein
MSIYLAYAIVVIIYLVWRNGKLRAAVTHLSARTELETPASERKTRTLDKLTYEWYDTDWPYDDEEHKEGGAKYENPAPFQFLDLYSIGLLLAEYKSASSSIEKKNVLRRIRNSGVRAPLEIADLAFSDDSPVRAWAAAHLDLRYSDFANRHTIDEIREAPVIRDFEKLGQTDPDPIVRASFYSNPECERLPWGMFKLVENWQELVASMAHIERLALMRNPDILIKLLVALMQESSERLNMTRDEHSRLICAGIFNPRIINSSRQTGRDFWTGFDGDPFPPSEEFGQMWQLAVDRWRSEHIVPYFVFKYIQTTSKAKLEAYNKLLPNPDRDSNQLRREILLWCDVFKDGAVLGAGVSDSDEECRKVADERLGTHKSWVVERIKKGKM